MLPLLRFAEDGIEHSSKEAVVELSKYFELTEDEKNRLYETKKVSIFYDRTHWALTYLKHANLVEGTRRGFFKITGRGKQVLKQELDKITDNFLRQFPEFLEFQTAKKIKKDTGDNLQVTSHKTPWELFEENYKAVTEQLAINLLNNVKNSSPEFFERLVVELLVSMGYGGSIKDAGRAVGRTGDEGIDGIIKEDVLGLDSIYIQAKKWNGTIGRPDIQKFAGALQGQRAKKGIFISTGNFSNDAIEYVSKLDSKIVLIDGNQLTEYMIDNNIGVTLEKSYLVKKLDSDYFEEQVD
jgi:restriction system protein